MSNDHWKVCGDSQDVTKSWRQCFKSHHTQTYPGHELHCHIPCVKQRGKNISVFNFRYLRKVPEANLHSKSSEMAVNIFGVSTIFKSLLDPKTVKMKICLKTVTRWEEWKTYDISVPLESILIITDEFFVLNI